MTREFVGRQRELNQLLRGAAEVQSGHPMLVFVEGEAGIGKTSLLAELAPRLTKWLQLSASGEEEETRLPYGLLMRLLAGTGLHAWDRTRGANAGESDPFAIGAELVQLLGDLQASGPVLLMIDDAPWADPQSLRALSFALRRLHADRVLTILGMRSEGMSRLPSGLVRLGRDAGVRVRLSGLTAQETRELANKVGQVGLSRRAAERVQQHTRGNPLYLRALFEELPAEELRSTDRPLRAPSSFDHVVLAALGGCSDSVRRLLTAAAVLGSRSPLEWAAEVAEVAEPLQALEDAASTQLVDAAGGPDGWVVAFRHPLIRAALYGDAGPVTRSRLHARAAVVVGEPGSLGHRVAAATGPDARLAAELIELAQSDAQAGRLGQAADRLIGASRLHAPGPARDELLLKGVGLLLRAGEANEAAGYTDRIEAMPETASRNLVQGQLAWMAGRQDEAQSLAHAAWLTGEPGEVAGAAAAMLAQLRILSDDGAGAAEWAERALSSGGLAEPIASAARINRAVGLALSGSPREALLSLADLPDDPATVAPGREDEVLVRGGIRLWTDDVTGAFSDLRGSVSTEAAAPRPYRLIGLGYLAQTEFRMGAWDDSSIHADQVASLVDDTDQVWLLTFAHAVAVFVPAGRGLWAEAEAHLEAAQNAARALGDQASSAYAANAAVHLAACRGDAAGVVSACEPLVTAGSGGSQEPGVFAWAAEYAEALVALQRMDEVESILDRLEGVAQARGLRSTLARVALIRGELAATRREWAEARSAFEAAVALGAGCVNELDRARGLAAYGRFLRRTGERDPATQHLQAAVNVFARLGAQPFADRCDAELMASGLALARPEERPDASLTPQERAVARLVCAGLSNREVAAELVVSVKTVGYHLGNAYTKLGVHSRTQLASVLHRSNAGEKP